jgi:hypothetical protein
MKPHWIALFLALFGASACIIENEKPANTAPRAAPPPLPK